MQDSQGPTWPTAVVALGFLGFVAAIFITAYARDGVDAALKVWGALGTVVGIVTGAIPSYFFRQTAQAAQKDADALRSAATPDVMERARQYGLRP